MNKLKLHKYTCLQCKQFKTFSIIKFAKHIKKEHNKKLTKKDLVFALKWHITTQILKLILAYPLAILIVIGWGITYPFWLLHNFLDSF